jgi:hypothetical protein
MTRTAEPFARALISGFIASTAMLLAFSITCGLALVLAGDQVGGLAGPSPAATAHSWLQALRASGLVDVTRPVLYQAIGLYLAAGLLWAVFYTHTFQHWLTGPEWERGLVFACLPWLFSVLVLMPLANAGLFGLALKAGPLPMLASLALHMIYGVTLSVLSGRAGDVVLGNGRPREIQRAALRSAEMGAAGGVVVGLFLGAALGLMQVSILQSASGAAQAGLHPLALVAATAAAGAAFGGLLGSFVGLARAEARLT